VNTVARVAGVVGALSIAACSDAPEAGTPAFFGSGAGNAGAAGMPAMPTAGAAGSSGAGGGSAASGGAGAAGVAALGGDAGAALGGGGAALGGAGNATGGAGGASGSAGAGGSAGDPNVGGADQGKQTARPINQPYAKNGFWEYLPQHYGNGFKRPLMVFWAGVGENGDGSANGLKVITDRHGPPKLIAQNQWPSERPFIVLSPQHGTQTDRPSPDEVHDFLTYAIQTYDVDPERVYLTGLSSGARGSWGYLGQYKGEQVAAAVLIAGDSSVAFTTGGCSVVNQVALWTFHGENDSEVPFADDTAGMNNFKACPQPREEVLYTTYPGVGHVDSWPRTYDLSAGHDIYAWFLTKQR
jgi:poly(3-hydroxybutyrate) depolymerase